MIVWDYVLKIVFHANLESWKKGRIQNQAVLSEVRVSTVSEWKAMQNAVAKKRVEAEAQVFEQGGQLLYSLWQRRSPKVSSNISKQ